MRLIGNKRKLLGEIEGVLFERGIRGGILIDIFSGSASVGKHFKRRGFRVFANDRLSMCYAQAVGGIEVSRFPNFRNFRLKYACTLGNERFREGLSESYPRSNSRRSNGWPRSAIPLLEAVHYLNRYVQPCCGLIFRNFCPGGTFGRRYFRDENGCKIDGILEFLRHEYRRGVIVRKEFYLLLTALLDAADRVANISGTYGAYLKSWQSNSVKTLVLEPPEVIESKLDHRAYREDGNELVRSLEGDILYVDPPYNHRQYAANYHVLEILAEYHTIDDLTSYEESLYGKTGLRPYQDLKSIYCVPPNKRNNDSGNVLSAMQDLILSTKAQHVVVSYNEEGLLSKEEIGDILAEFSGRPGFDYRADFLPVLYQRFRSDQNRDGSSEKGIRNYRVLRGRNRDEIAEWIFFATRSDSSRARL